MNKRIARNIRSTRVRSKLKKIGINRLVVFRSSRHIYAQIVLLNDDRHTQVLVAASTLEKVISQQVKNTGNKSAARIVGKTLAIRALEKKITSISFDRSGYKFHGRIKALADSAREIGLKF